MILSRLLGRNSSENPANPITDDDGEFVDDRGGNIKPNRNNSFACSAVWKAVGLISGYCGKLPCKINTRVDQAWEPDRTHPAYKLVHRKCNPYMTARTFRQVLTKHALIDGAGYAGIYREQARPVELWPLDPVATYPVIWYADGSPEPQIEFVTTVGGQMARLSPADVINVKGLSDDGIEGMRMIDYARDAVGLSMEAERFGRMFFKSGLQPSGVLMYPRALKQPAIDNLRRSFQRAHAGLNKAFRLVILEEGGKLEQTNLDNEKAQFLQTRDFQIRDIANFFMMSPHKLGDMQRQGYASLEQENQAFLQDCLDFWLTEWEGEYSLKLLTEAEQENETHNVKFNRNALVSTDIASRFNAYETSLRSGIMNPDEVRAREELPPRPGGQAYYIPLNMGLVGPDGQIIPATDANAPASDRGTDRAVEPVKPPPTITADADNARKANRELVDWAVGRGFHRITARARHYAVRGAAGFLDWLDTDKIAETREGITNVLAPVLAATRAGGYTEHDEFVVADNLIGRVRGDLLELAETATAKTLPEALADYIRNNQDTLPRQFAGDIVADCCCDSVDLGQVTIEIGEPKCKA